MHVRGNKETGRKKEIHKPSKGGKKERVVADIGGYFRAIATSKDGLWKASRRPEGGGGEDYKD